MTYKANCIASYVSKLAIDKDRNITHLQLHKILYYLQAHWLVTKNEVLFEDEIEKWRIGPVISSVFNEYKIFRANPITFIPKIITVNDDCSVSKEKFSLDMISEEDRNEIRPIVDNLSFFSGLELTEKTFNHDLWKYDESIIFNEEEKLFYDIQEIKSFFEMYPEKLNICYE